MEPTIMYCAGNVTVTHGDENDAYLLAFGRNIKAQRIYRGMTEEQLATAAGMHCSFIRNVERGTSGPVNLIHLAALARALSMTQAELLPVRLR